MIKIVNHYLEKKERLLKYRRDYDLEKALLIKDKQDIKQKVVTSNKKDTTNREVTKKSNLYKLLFGAPENNLSYFLRSQVSIMPVMGAITLDLVA